MEGRLIMKRYSEWSPSPHDTKGLNLPDRQDWIVVPTIRARDSGPLDESNFAVALATLGGENAGEDENGENGMIETHSFNHWACGWFEIILAHPSRELEVQAIADRLENYPILDENDLSERELEAEGEGWESYARRDVTRKLVEDFGLSDAAEALLDESGETIYAALICGHHYSEGIKTQIQVEHDDEGPRFDTDQLDPMTREEMALLLRLCRKEKRAAMAKV